MKMVSEGRRLIVLDIETIGTDEAVQDAALSALTGKIVCLAMLVERNGMLIERGYTGDEVEILTRFWKVVKPTDLIVGHNALEFDLPFILQRSCILNIKPPFQLDLRRYYTAQVFDTMQQWTNWDRERGPLWIDLQVLSAADQRQLQGPKSRSGTGRANLARSDLTASTMFG